MKDSEQNIELERTSWGKYIPWVLSASCIVVLAVIGYFLIENIQWYKDTVFCIDLINAQEPVYRIHAYHIHMSMMKNSVGLFSGFAIMFLGLGVAFYSLRKPIDLDVKSNIWSVSIATASPGIIALLMGGTIIMFTIQNKSSFASYPVIYENYSRVNKNQEPERVKKDSVTVIVNPFKTTKQDSI